MEILPAGTRRRAHDPAEALTIFCRGLPANHAKLFYRVDVHIHMYDTVLIACIRKTVELVGRVMGSGSAQRLERRAENFLPRGGFAKVVSGPFEVDEIQVIATLERQRIELTLFHRESDLSLAHVDEGRFPRKRHRLLYRTKSQSDVEDRLRIGEISQPRETGRGETVESRFERVLPRRHCAKGVSPGIVRVGNT